MVQILPRFDPGGEVGKAFGSGLGQQAGISADRQRMLSALNELDQLDKPIEYTDESGTLMQRAPSFAEKLRTLVKSGAGIPGWMNVVESLAPTLLKEAEGKAADAGLQRKKKPAETVEQVTGYSEEDGEPSQGGPLQENVTRLQETVKSFVEPRSRLPEDLMSEVPRFNEQPPAYEIPSREELSERMNDFIQAGSTPQKAFEQMQREIQLGLQDWDSKMKNYTRSLGEFQQRRGLEETQRQFVDQQSQEYLPQLGIGSKDGVPKFYSDLAYRLFQDEKNKKGAKARSDQEIWSQARQKLGQFVEHEAAGASQTRPLLFGSKTLGIPPLAGAKNSIKQTQGWVDNYLKMAGNTPESREKAKTILMDNGWSRHKALEFVQPLSSELSTQFNKLPKLSKELPGPQGQVPQKTVQDNKKKMEQIQAMVPYLAKNFGDRDSLYLLRNDLVRKKGLNKIQADEIVEEVIQARGGLLPHQAKEQALLSESPQKDAWRIFYDLMFGEEE